MKILFLLFIPCFGILSCNTQKKEDTEERSRGKSGYWLSKAEKPIVPEATENLSRALAAVNYYVSTSGNDGNNGTSETTAWKTLSKVQSSIKDGDVVLLKRGESFSGTLTVNVSNVTFGAYGTGNKPKLIGTGKEIQYLIYSSRSGLIFRDLEITDPLITDHAVRNKDANIERAFTFEGTNCKIINCKIELVGVAGYFVGGSNTMDSCDVGNLRMVVDTDDGGQPGNDDDYGANPLVISSANNTITHNNFHDCWATSFDYDWDGGAVEFYGAGCDNNFIAYNTIVDNIGLLEINGNSKNNTFAYNKMINNGSLLYFQSGSTYSGYNFYNNVIVENAVTKVNESRLIGGSFGSSVTLKNNIFWLTNGVDIITGGTVKHDNNIYKVSGSSAVGFSLTGTEISNASPFKNSTNTNPLQWDYSSAVGKDKGVDVGIKIDFAGKATSGLPDIGILEEGSVTPPPCVPATETRLVSCPAGQTGIITEERKFTCPENTWSNWYVISNTCTTLPPPACVPKTETRNIACPTGQTGTITQTRNYVCTQGTGTWTVWTTTGSNCIVTPPPPAGLFFNYDNKIIYLDAPVKGTYKIYRDVWWAWFPSKSGSYPAGKSQIKLTLSSGSYLFKSSGNNTEPFKIL